MATRRWRSGQSRRGSARGGWCRSRPPPPGRATPVPPSLGDIFGGFGGVVHQAEDEIAAAGVAIGASFAGNPAFTVTSGPGLALQTEFIGLAVLTETPLGG